MPVRVFTDQKVVPMEVVDWTAFAPAGGDRLFKRHLDESFWCGSHDRARSAAIGTGHSSQPHAALAENETDHGPAAGAQPWAR